MMSKRAQLGFGSLTLTVLSIAAADTRAEPTHSPIRAAAVSAVSAQAPQLAPSGQAKRACAAALTIESHEEGEQVHGSCVANTQCVRACGARLGEAIAAGREPQDVECTGDSPCQQSESERNLRIATANLQYGPFIGCLQLCWRAKSSGECRWDRDCAPSGPCSTGICADGTCEESVKYDGVRCVDTYGAVGVCSKNQCVGSREFLASCGARVSAYGEGNWWPTARVSAGCWRARCWSCITASSC